MKKLIQCPTCVKNTFDCKTCSGLGLVDQELYEQLMALTNKLRTETQIPHQYFAVSTLFLVNVSLTENPDHNQVYAIYKFDGINKYIKVETMTVNVPTEHAKDLVVALFEFINQPMSEYESEIRAYDDQLTVEELELFKLRFSRFEASY
ncbi:MAG: hypothetical protein ACE3L7_33210 [Candidatus Pristimantibacillus sp.]